MPIAPASHHRFVGFDHQHPWRRRMLLSRRFVVDFNVGHRGALLAFELGPQAFGLRAQRFAADPDASQVGQEFRCLAKRGDRAQRRFPAREPLLVC